MGFTLPAGEDWTHVFFPIGLTDLTALDGKKRARESLFYRSVNAVG